MRRLVHLLGRNKAIKLNTLVMLGLGFLAVISVAVWPTSAPLVTVLMLAAIWLQSVVVGERVIKHRARFSAKSEEQAYREHLRGRRMETVLRDTAGSVGRMAPTVRALDERFKKIEQAIGSLSVAQPAAGPAAKAPKSAAFPEVSLAPKGEPRNTNVTAMVVADPFTLNALAFEWRQVVPKPSDWREHLDRNNIDVLFVESAWEGNDGAWRHQLTGQTAPRPEMLEMVGECRKRGIPTVFWNKEDPPHFEDFLTAAKLFDYVFTTESSLVPEYKERLGHENVGVLAFAAAPDIHNPARVAGVVRDRAAVFGGMYFRHKYPERREQMDYLLSAAKPMGLDIYSRQLGGDLKYQFPDELKGLVKGGLSYPQMLAAYHAYKVVLNVNSVPSSESMCARRIFEATACGAAVLSPSTPAIDAFFPEAEITTVTNQKEAEVAIKVLLRSPFYRERLVHQAQRRIWEHHTYSHRVNRVLKACGLAETRTESSVSCIVTTNRPGQVENIFETFARQQVDSKELVLLTHGFELSANQVEELKDRYQVADLVLLNAPTTDTLGRNLNRLADAASGEFLARMDDDDWYGANYVRDLCNAQRFSRAQLVGKASSYVYFEGLNVTALTYAAQENRFTDFVRGATFAGPRSTFKAVRFQELSRSEDSTFLRELLALGGRIYSADRFNFVVTRRADKMTHTWGIGDMEFLASGEMQFVGDGREQLDV